MKKTLSITFALLLSCFVSKAITTFIGYNLNGDGTPNTNAVQIQAWPSQNTWITYGSNVVYGGLIQTNIPNAAGVFTNKLYPNVYRVMTPALNSAYLVVIPDTSVTNPLAFYVTNVTVVNGSYFDAFGMVTNWIHYWPATNSPDGINAAIGFILTSTNDVNWMNLVCSLATNVNTVSLMAMVSTNANALTLIQALSTNANAVSLMATVSTNANALTLIQALSTNANAVTLIQALSTNANAMTMMNSIATNWTRQATNTLPAPALAGLVPLANLSTNVNKWLSISTAPAALVSTNAFGLTVLIYQTNGEMGTTLTNFAWGSICFTTNGGRYTLSNNYSWWPF